MYSVGHPVNLISLSSKESNIARLWRVFHVWTDQTLDDVCSCNINTTRKIWLVDA